MKRLTLVTPLLAFLVIGCSSPAVKRQVVEVKAEPGQVRAQPIPLVPTHEKIDPRAFHFFVNATLYEQMGNPLLAAINYKKSLEFFPESYEIRFSLAKNLYRMEKYEDALVALAEISPVDTSVQELRAGLYQAMGAEDSACISFLELVKLNHNDSRAYSYLASFYRKHGNLDSTVWAYENLVRLKPDHSRLWSELARLQAEKGDYDAAKKSFWSSIEVAKSPHNILPYIGLEELYQAMQQPDSALIVLNMALEVEPDNVLAHRGLRGLYVSMDSLGLALPHAIKEVELAPLNRSAARRLGVLYYWLDSLQQADSIFSYLVESGDQHPANHSFLGRIALRNDELERACKQFAIVTQLADSVHTSWLDLGYVYRLMGEPDKEIETYRSGLSHMRDDQNRLRLLFALGVVYEQHGRIEESIAIFEELIAKDPDFDPALNYLGYMLADRGEQLEYAKELIQQAVSISPDNAAYLDSYGWVSYRLGNYDQALVYLKKAVSLDNDSVVFDHLGDVYKAVGDTEQARTWWQKALEMDPDNERIKEKLGL